MALQNITYSPPEPIQDYYDKLIAAINTINLAAGGANKAFLMKSSGSDFAWTYVVLNLDGGDTGEFLQKSSSSDYAFQYVKALEIQDDVRVRQNKITIGAWNMSSDSTKTVAHGLNSTQWKAIRNIFVYIRNDADTKRYSVGRSSADGECDMSVNEIDSTNITLARKTGGEFDDATFNDTGFDRGYIVIEYEV